MDQKVSLNIVKNWQALCTDIVFAYIAPSLLQNHVITINEYQHIASQPEITKTECLLLVLLKKNEDVLMKFGESLEKNYSWLAEKVKEGCIKKLKEEDQDEVDAKPFMIIDSCEKFENYSTVEDDQDTCMECKNLSSDNITLLNNKLNNIKEEKTERRRRRIPKSRIKNRLKPKVQNTDKTESTESPVVIPQKEPVNLELNEEVTDEVITIVKNNWMLAKSWTSIAHSLGLTDRVHDIRVKAMLFGEDSNMCVVHLIKTWLETFPKAATLSKLIKILRSENFNKVADELTEILHREKVTDNPEVVEIL